MSTILFVIRAYTVRAIAIIGFIDLAKYFNHWWIALFSIFFITGSIHIDDNNNSDSKENDNNNG